MEPINLMGGTVLTAEDLKSRAMTRLAAQGLGMAERLANVERMAYAQAGLYTPSPAIQAQMDAIGQMLKAEELVYEQEKADTALLAETIDYEAAQRRLALPVAGDDLDTAERASAQAVIDSVAAEVAALVAQRAANA